MIPASVRIFVCTRPYDMRCSYDTLALAAQQVIGEDPQSGALWDAQIAMKGRCRTTPAPPSKPA